MTINLAHKTNALGFAKAPEDTRVVVAMSGGVDSSVVAAMLKQEGFEVIGITLQLYDHGAAIKNAKACCAGQDIYDARRIAETFDFPHYVLDYESKFNQGVMDDFADTYLQGATPIPCVRCNQTVKFGDLLLTAKELGADCMATGHYVQRLMGEDGPELHRGVDPQKDQSYFLFATTREQLAYLRFPLGGLEKTKTRKLAQDFGLSVAAKPDSQDICFVPDGKYTDIIKKIRPQAANPGDIVHTDGRVLGRHDGIMHFTVGQRRGLGLQDGSGIDPLYVLRLDASKNQVIVGPRKKLTKSRIFIKDVNWLGAGNFGDALDSVEILVKVRSTKTPVPARLDLYQDQMSVVLQTPIEGVSPGQACVFYDSRENGSRVLGGGWITNAQ